MNSKNKDYVNTFINRMLLLMVILLLIQIVEFSMVKHTINNFVDKPTVSVASPSIIKAPSIFVYKLPEVIIPKPTVEIEVKVERQQQVLSRGGSGLSHSKPLTEKEQIKQYVREICAKYDNRVTPELVMSMIEHESSYNPKAKVGSCLGLMQVSSRWHANRAARLGVSDFYDPYSNVLLGVDYLNELLAQYQDVRLVLMMYNMNHNDALSMYRQGKISTYAKSVISKANNYK